MGKIAFLFTGQGAQHVGMGKDFYESLPVCRELFDLGERLRPGTITQCFSSDEETLKQTENTQPCLFLTDLSCALALSESGIYADYAAGFSLGEIPALAYAGILSTEDAFRLVTLRGEKMSECGAATPGSMAAVLRLPNEKIELLAQEFDGVYPVNYNCPGQLVVAGKTQSMPLFSERVKAEGGKAVPLAVSGAFHTPFMEKAASALKENLKTLTVHAPVLPLISNTTAQPYPSDLAEIIVRISEQVTHPVRFEETLRYLSAQGVTEFIEVGAGKALSGFVKKTLGTANSYVVNDIASLAQTVEALHRDEAVQQG